MFIKKHELPIDKVLDDYVKNVVFIVYFNHETTLCLIINEYNVYDPRDKEDDFALRIISTHLESVEKL